MPNSIKDLIKEISTKENIITFFRSQGIEVSENKKALCPLHSEKTESFSIYANDSGKWLWKCHGCGKMGDMTSYLQITQNLRPTQATREVCKILNIPCDIEPSKIEKFEEFLKTCNDGQPQEFKSGGNTYYFEKMHVYTDETGNPLYSKNRYKAKGPNAEKKKTFTTKALIETENSYKFDSFKDTRKVPYNLPRVKKAILENKVIYITEGEKDCETLLKYGFKSATTFYNSKSWEDSYTDIFKGSNAKIVFIGDTGEAGEKYKKLVWNNLKDVIKCFKVVDLPKIQDLGNNADVTDWLEAGHTKEELLKAIRDAWDWKLSTRWKDVKVTDKKDGTRIIKPKKTIDNFKLILKETNTELFFNEISKQIEVKTQSFKNANLNTLETEITSYATKQEFPCNAQDVNKWLAAVAYENNINPFRDFLDGLEGTWDNKSRLQDFYNLFNTVEFFNDDLKEIILRRWLLQFIDSAYNPGFKSQGVLVLKGRQGIYKTTSMSYLIPIKEPWVFLAEQKFEDTRDQKQIITSNQLVELSEFARSNKQIDALKGFVTAATDKLVLKYDKHPVEYKRKTVYYATVNDAEFLLDDENRRFWVLDLVSIDIEGIKKFNFEQLWAELYYIYHVENDKRHWLEPREISLLEESNQNYKFKGELEGQLETHFDFSNSRRVWLTSVEVMSFLDGKYSTSKISRALKGMRIEQKQISNKHIPRNRYNAMPLPRVWGGSIPVAYKNRISNFELIDCVSPFDSEVAASTQEAALKKELANAKVLIMNKDTLIENKNKALAKKDEEIKKLQSQIMELMYKSSINSSNNSNLVSKEEYEQQTVIIKNQAAKIEELENEMNFYIKELDNVGNENTDLENKVTALEGKISDIERQTAAVGKERDYYKKKVREFEDSFFSNDIVTA